VAVVYVIKKRGGWNDKKDHSVAAGLDKNDPRQVTDFTESQTFGSGLALAQKIS
jgi:hypothetical protein